MAKGINKKYETSEELADFLGHTKAVKRPEVTKAVWAYAKQNDLQDGQYIEIDHELSFLTNKKRIHGIKDLQKLISPHLFSE